MSNVPTRETVEAPPEFFTMIEKEPATRPVWSTVNVMLPAPPDRPLEYVPVPSIHWASALLGLPGATEYTPATGTLMALIESVRVPSFALTVTWPFKYADVISVGLKSTPLYVAFIVRPLPGFELFPVVGFDESEPPHPSARTAAAMRKVSARRLGIASPPGRDGGTRNACRSPNIALNEVENRHAEAVSRATA